MIVIIVFIFNMNALFMKCKVNMSSIQKKCTLKYLWVSRTLIMEIIPYIDTSTLFEIFAFSLMLPKQWCVISAP